MFSIAIVSLNVKSISCEAFAKKLERFIAKAKSKDVTLFLLPELSIAPILEVMDGDSIKASLFLEAQLKHLALKYQMYVCGGSGIYAASAHHYNQSFLINPTGAIVYQPKLNLIESEKQEGLSKGQTLTIIKTPFVKLGIAVCYDIEFPEIIRKLVEQGVELILNPSYTADLYGVARVAHCAQARAIENHVYIAKSCLVGKLGHPETPAGFGASCLYSPIDHGFNVNGIVASSRTHREGMIITPVDLQALARLKQQKSTSPFRDYLELKPEALEIKTISF